MEISSDNQKLWHALTADETAQELKVDPGKDLSKAEAADRLQQYGPNTLTEKKAEPYWRAFIRQYKDYMRIVLLAAAVGSLLSSRALR